MERSRKRDSDGKPRPARTVPVSPSVLYTWNIDGRLRNPPVGFALRPG